MGYFLGLSLIIAPASVSGMEWFKKPVYEGIPYVQDMHESTCKYLGIKDMRSSLESIHEKISNIYGSLLVKTALRLYVTDYLSRGAATRFLLNSCVEQPRWWMQLGTDLIIGVKAKSLEEFMLDSFVGYFIPGAITGDYRLPYEYAKELVKEFYVKNTK